MYVGNLSYDVKFGDLLQFMRGGGWSLSLSLLRSSVGFGFGSGSGVGFGLDVTLGAAFEKLPGWCDVLMILGGASERKGTARWIGCGSEKLHCV